LTVCENCGLEVGDFIRSHFDYIDTELCGTEDI